MTIALRTFIWLAIGALVLGFLVGPKIYKTVCGDVRVDLRIFVEEARELSRMYRGACPSQEMVSRSVGYAQESVELYGCVPGLRGPTFVVAYTGPDQRAGTIDDIIIVQEPE